MTEPTLRRPGPGDGRDATGGRRALDGRHRRVAGDRSTIEDVATAAGVSVATVSRALRGLPNVAASTRERVAAVADELGYRPDPAAARLAAGRSTVVTVVVPDLAGWYFSTVVAGVEAVCADAGYDLSVTGVGSLDAFARLTAVDHHLERRTDGLIIVDVPVADELACSLRDRGLAVATIGTSGSVFPWVAIDDGEVATLAMEHLLGLGHRRIGLIGGQQRDPMNFEVPRRRSLGYEHAVVAAGADLDPDLVVPGNFGIDDGREAMAALLDLARPPTAVFVMSDEMAFGALMELRTRDLIAGTDVSIVGVDDHEFSRVVDLTTVRQPVTAHGAVAARLVIEQLRAGRPVDPDARTGPIGYAAPLELVIRATTGPPSTTPAR